MRALLFDWGNTLMRVLPEEVGPTMAHWARVEAIPHAREALRALHATYLTALATNGGAAGVPLVRAALARVGLDESLGDVFTATDLGTRKPDPTFFLAATRRLGVLPHEAVMIGDSYAEDVVGAKEAGLSAVWWNERCLPCPDTAPLYDAELLDMQFLPELLASPFLPDVSASLALLEGEGATRGLVAHSRAVAGAAFLLATRLRDRGVPVDPLLAHRGGLLHDLDKASTEMGVEPHGARSGVLLRQLGFENLARIAERHPISSVLHDEGCPTTWEERLVFYADKVVEGDAVVGVDRRIAALSRRYPTAPTHLASFASCLPLVLDLEAEIARRLGVVPLELLRQNDGQAGGSFQPHAPHPSRSPSDRLH